MAVHDLGYREWTGRLAPDGSRVVVITVNAARRAWQSSWLRRTLFFAWLPAVWFGAGFFFWEQSLLYPELRNRAVPFLSGMPQTAQVGDVLRRYDAEDPTAARHAVWAWLLQSFFRYPQGVIMVMVVGMIAPPAISQDIRSRAFLIYFSRPLTAGEYILGKMIAIWVYLAIISTIPAVALYLLGVLLSPEFDVVWATWDLPLRILAASAVLMIPTASLALCLSSMTQESRYAGFAWFAIWILGWFTYAVMTSLESLETGQLAPPELSGWSHLSLYHTLGRVQRWVFGYGEFRDIVVPTAILIVVTAVSTMVMFRRVEAPMRV